MKTKLRKIIREDPKLYKFFNWLRNTPFMRLFPRLGETTKIYFRLKSRNLDKFKLKDLEIYKKRIYTNEWFLPDNSLKRIIEAYKKSKLDQKKEDSAYKIGGGWEFPLTEFYNHLKEAIEKDDLKKVREILNNFAIDKISMGLSLVGDLPINIKEKIEILNRFNLAHHHYKNLTRDKALPSSYPTAIGNSFGLDVDEGVVMLPSFRQSYFAERINDLLQDVKKPTIVEIGGGYGGIAYHLYNEHIKEFNYLNFDIPEVCIIATYFLMSAFPDSKFLLYGEKDLKDVKLKDYEFIILPNYAIKNLPNQCCDMVFNSHSLTEMDYSSVKEYIKQTERISKKYFLHANHEYGENAKYRLPDGTMKQHVDMNDPEFEPTRDKFKKIYRLPEIIQSEMGEGTKYSYFEYLYEKLK